MTVQPPVQWSSIIHFECQPALRHTSGSRNAFSIVTDVFYPRESQVKGRWNGLLHVTVSIRDPGSLHSPAYITSAGTGYILFFYVFCDNSMVLSCISLSHTE